MNDTVCFRNIGQLVQVDTANKPPRLKILYKHALIVKNGRVEKVLKDSGLKSSNYSRVIDLKGKTVIPGLVDCHTHLIYAGERKDEMERRLDATSYMDILKSGDGILSTVKATREADGKSLLKTAKTRMKRMMALGTTAFEIKSGYGLDIETEKKILSVGNRLKKELPVPVTLTYLGAHRVLAKLVDLAGHAVVEPHAEGQQQVSALGHLPISALGVLLELAADCPVGGRRTVHAEPTQRKLVRLRKCAHTHDRAGDRDTGRGDKSAQRVAGIGADDAATHVEQRPLALLDQPDDLVEFQFASLAVLGIEPVDVHLVGEENLGTGLLDVFWHVDDHRTGPAAGGDLECLFHHSWDFVDVGNEVAVFHHRQGHAEKVRLLKRALANHRLRHLTGDGDKRD